MWIQKVGNPSRYFVFAKCENGLFSSHRFTINAEDVSIDCEMNNGDSVEFDSMKFSTDGTLLVTAKKPATLYEAAGVIAREHPQVNPSSINDLIAAYYREQGNLDRLLKEIDALPPPSPEIPYDLLLSVYDAAEDLAKKDVAGDWYWRQEYLYQSYRTEATREFHKAIIAIRDWKKNNSGQNADAPAKVEA